MKNIFLKYGMKDGEAKDVLKTVVLYFPDRINLKAFALVENMQQAEVNYTDSLLQAALSAAQVQKACATYGAILKE
jgi:hypothetical protein